MKEKKKKWIAVSIALVGLAGVGTLLYFFVFRPTPEFRLLVTYRGWSGWSEEQPKPEEDVFDPVTVGTDLYYGIKVKKVRYNSIIIEFQKDRYSYVEPNPDRTINLRKEPLEKLVIKCGEEKEIVTQSMDGGTHLYFKLEKK